MDINMYNTVMVVTYVWTQYNVLSAGNHMEQRSCVLSEVSEYIAHMDDRFIGCTI